ncbi:MAG: S41 family peptidase [Leadbetterella sp.]
MNTKKYKIAFFFIIVLTWFQVTVVAQSGDCSCRKNFDEIYQKVVDNYSGYPLKVTPLTKSKFEGLSKKTKKASTKAETKEECEEVINKWLAFFEDNHLFLNISAKFDAELSESEKAKRSKELGSQPYTSLKQFEEYVYNNKSKLEPIEGVWESDDKAYLIGIIKQGQGYSGFLLNSKDNHWNIGRNKFFLENLATGGYKATYYYADFLPEVNFARLIKNYLYIENVYKFSKLNPTPTVSVTGEDLANILTDYRVEKVDAKTALVVLPPFTMSNAINFTAEILKRNASTLDNAENMIIDLRNNPGGEEMVFDPLFAYIADKPIVRKGNKIRATQENFIALSHEVKSLQDIPQYKNLITKLKFVVDKMQANMGSMIQGPDITFQPQKGKVLPKKVVILVNEKTSSTAESIALEAKQSSRVIIMGKRTKGACDFTEVRDWSLPCYNFRIALPMGYCARLPEKPMENIGINPDVVIPDTEVDWVGFTQRYLNSLSK